jgi:hypothetical protein
MRKIYLFVFTITLLLISINVMPQGVAINDNGNPPDASAMLDVTSTSKGILIPRMNKTDRNDISSPVPGLIIYQTSDSEALSINDLTDGKTGGSSVFLGTDAGKNDDGSYNRNVAVGDSAFYSNTTGSSNVAIGPWSLYNSTTRSFLVAIGDSALFNNGIGATETYHAIGNTAVGSKSLYSNTTGSINTANGTEALYNNTTGSYNTANGYKALYSHTTGHYNTANGYMALFSDTTGYQNTAIGSGALYNNTTGSFNTANGDFTLFFNTTGSSNTANGQALYNNTTGNYNTANGRGALYSNTTGNLNTAIGTRTLFKNTTRSNLVAIGDSALFNNGTGATESYHAVGNTAVGSKALYSNTKGYYNTATGYQSLDSNTTGYKNTANGYQSLYCNTTGYQNTANGYRSLYANTVGLFNTAGGFLALYSNIGGAVNTAFGSEALKNNTFGSSNVGIGAHAMIENVSGINNIAVGHDAMYENTDGNRNIGIGKSVNYNNSSGNDNTIIGHDAGYGTSSNDMSANVFIGSQTGYKAEGDSNVFIGFKAGYNETGNHKLFVDNTSTAYPLIYGEFNDNLIRVHGDLELRDMTATPSLKLYEPFGSGSHFTLFQTQAQGANINYTLPAVAGTNGQVLQTDASGMLSWSSPATGDITAVGSMISGSVFSDATADGDWLGLGASAGRIQFVNQTPDEVYILSANVGIGTTTPEGMLHVNGRLELPDNDASSTPGTGSIEIGNQLRIDNNEIIMNTDQTLYLQKENNGDLQVDNLTLVVDASENRVGIGTTTPDTRLDVNGVITMQEVSATPANPSTQARMYIKGDKFIVQFNDGGTIKYRYMDLTSTNADWTYTTTAP